MSLRPLPIGAGCNLDIDQTTTHDGAAVAYYNMYLDRGNAIIAMPGLVEYDDTATGQAAYEYFSIAHQTRFTVSGGRVWAQYNKDVQRVVLSGGGSLSAVVPPTFAEDSDNVFVAADSVIYKIASGAMTALGGNSPTGVTSLLYHGGFLIANGPEIAGDVTYSDDKGNNYATWEVYNNESKPDKLQSLLLVDSQFIYNFGEEVVEVTYLGGDPTNPFEINRGRLSSIGCIAKYSPNYDGEKVRYLSNVNQRRAVVESAQGAPSIISFPIDIPLEQFERVDDAQGFSMAFKGQNFYCLYFPTANMEVNEQYYESITLAYHIQRKQWLILAKWNGDTGSWEAYRGVSFSFIEPWNLKLVGCRTTGKTYQLIEDTTVDYVGETILQHRWRDDNSKTWGAYRNISLGTAGDYKRPTDQFMNGRYINRQHEISISDMRDGGESYRGCIISGNVNHQVDTTKRSNYYRYNLKRGTNEIIINTISEDITVLRR